MSANLSVTIDGPVATITLDRGEKLNALTMAMLDALEAACGTIDRDESVRAVIVASASEKAFCAGADIVDWGPLGGLACRALDRDGTRLRPARAPPPADDRGDRRHRLRRRVELALACDLRIAAAGARGSLSGGHDRAVPGWAGPRLPRMVGAGRAKQMILAGEPIDAATAAAWGLVNEVVPADRLATRALELARRIAENAPTAVQASKQLVDAAAGEGLAAALEALAAGLAAGTADAHEGVAAFREKRKPKFTGQ
jgi:enoyl-CoA hydratase/carnithine racemase